MIEINGTFLFQLAFFLVFMLVVNLLLFRPMRAYLARRQRTIDNLKSGAGGADASFAELSSAYTHKIAAAREEMLGCRASARKDALAKQRAILDEAKRQAILEVDAAEDELKREIEAARAHLRREMRPLADAISAKVLGRPV